MSDHFNSLLMNDVLIRLEEQSFFADIGEERTLRFVQDSLALSRRHDGNLGEALAGVGQVLMYNGAPAWTPQSCTEGSCTEGSCTEGSSTEERDGFGYTFIDVGRLRPDEARSHEPVAALSSPTTAIERARR